MVDSLYVVLGHIGYFQVIEMKNKETPKLRHKSVAKLVVVPVVLGHHQNTRIFIGHHTY